MFKSREIANKWLIIISQLLTHSAGIAYEFTHPKFLAWRQWSLSQPNGRANQRSRDIAIACNAPLLFQPGEGWVYGYNTDWAGLAVMRATDLTLEEYMQRNIWGPLGMTSTTFSPTDHRPDLLPRLAGMTERDGDGYLNDVAIPKWVGHVRYSGGGGCWSTANDYVKLCASLLRSATASSPFDEQLVSPDTAKAMFSQQLAGKATAELSKTVSSPLAFGLAGNIPAGLKVNFGLGGILNLEKVPTTGRARQAMQWCGIPNLFWWISPGDGICGCSFGQLIPEGDRRSVKMYELFEKAVLDDIKTTASKL
jgi:CubicO group peptidase (beta-lactamase class C family)